MTDLLSIPENYDLFSIACPHYDELQTAVGGAVQDAILKSAAAFSQKFFLDIGCGLGDTTMAVRESCHPPFNFFVCALDSNPAVMTKLEAPYLRDILSIVSDALPFLERHGPNYFDCVYSAWTLHNFERDYRSNVLKEVCKVLKPTGTFVLADKILPDSLEELRCAYVQQEEWFDVFDKIRRPDLKEAWRQHYLEDLHPTKVWYDKEAVQDLKSAGFKDVKTKHVWGLERLIVAMK